MTATTGLNAIEAGLTRINASDITVVRDCTITQIVSASANYYPADSRFGWATSCTSSTCYHADTVLNLSAAVSGQQRRKTATHEFGHVAGLTHQSTDASVMKQGDSPPISEWFDNIDFNEINGRY